MPKLRDSFLSEKNIWKVDVPVQARYNNLTCIWLTVWIKKLTKSTAIRLYIFHLATKTSSRLYYSTIVPRVVQTPFQNPQSLLGSQFRPEMTLVKSQQNFHFHLKSNALFTPTSNIYFKKFSRWLESS